MARRRCIADKIIESTAFYELPKASQALYTHLLMNTDDDGIVEAGLIMRAGRFKGRDLNELLEVGFVAEIGQGKNIVYVAEFQSFNTVRADRSTPSVHRQHLIDTFPALKNRLFTPKTNAFGVQIDSVSQVKSSQDKLKEIKSSQSKSEEVKLSQDNIAQDNSANDKPVVTAIDSDKQTNYDNPFFLRLTDFDDFAISSAIKDVFTEDDFFAYGDDRIHVLMIITEMIFASQRWKPDTCRRLTENFCTLNQTRLAGETVTRNRLEKLIDGFLRKERMKDDFAEWYQQTQKNTLDETVMSDQEARSLIERWIDAKTPTDDEIKNAQRIWKCWNIRNREKGDWLLMTGSDDFCYDNDGAACVESYGTRYYEDGRTIRFLPEEELQ